MSKILSPETTEARAALSGLFENAPVLVEVRFPRMGTSSDWYFVEEEEEFTALLNRLGAGVEVRLASVWDLDLDGVKGRLCLRK
ncbi:MAG TPA: hypothetical protein VEL76_03170 [Gemmataceae bacterium]|nr:hypothetical protein [Gemmataceae bacterium]